VEINTEARYKKLCSNTIGFQEAHGQAVISVIKIKDKQETI
jgi:hypothetical protein